VLVEGPIVEEDAGEVLRWCSRGVIRCDRCSKSAAMGTLAPQKLLRLDGPGRLVGLLLGKSRLHMFCAIERDQVSLVKLDSAHGRTRDEPGTGPAEAVGAVPLRLVLLVYLQRFIGVAGLGSFLVEGPIDKEDAGNVLCWCSWGVPRCDRYSKPVAIPTLGLRHLLRCAAPAVFSACCWEILGGTW
jgi:hypothetical protein